MQTYHYVIKGRVQGVGFRYHTLQQALKDGIKGTIKNLVSGDVEIYAQGTPEALASFEAYLETGPPFANVKNVTKQEVGPYSAFSDFNISY